MNLCKGWTSLFIWFTSVLLGSSANFVEASVTDFDSFESYTPALNLAGNSGGTGWVGAWGATGGVTSTTVETAALSAAGVNGGNQAVKVNLTGAAASQIASARQLSGLGGSGFAAANASDAAIYVGYLVSYRGAGTLNLNNTFSMHLSNSSIGTTSFNFGMRNSANANDRNNTADPLYGGNFVVRSATGAAAASGQAFGPTVGAGGSDYYLVAEISTTNTLNYDHIKVWVNPTFTSITDTPTGNGFLDLAAGTGLTTISHLFFRQAALDANDIFFADNAVVGTAWADVVPNAIPEPSSLSLLGGFGLALLARRRRS